jgi:L-ascorbate metabolism protein UlaG (beta-lactamase superfamily)
MYSNFAILERIHDEAMIQPVISGRALIEEIDHTITPTPTLWWLGHAGFIVRFATITFYIDPFLSASPGRVLSASHGSVLSAHAERLIAAPLDASDIRHADLILATHAHPGHLDAPAIVEMLASSKQAKLALPKSAAEAAHSAGVPYNRMTTTDAGLRIEYFKDNLYGRVYAIPSAHPQLDWTADGGYPYLGYVIRFGRWTIYHAGDCAMYDGLADRLRPFNVNVALLPVGGANFSATQAAQIARDIGADWLVPMHYGMFGESDSAAREESDFVAHMLGHRPEQRFKVFQPGEKWTVPED